MTWDLFILLVKFTGSLFILGAIVFRGIPEQMKEVREKQIDQYTNLRWILLYSLALVAISSLPSLFNTVAKLLGYNIELLADITTFANGIFQIAFGVLILLIWTYSTNKEK